MTIDRMQMEPVNHALLIGATGMLAEAGRWIAARSRQISVLSRHPEEFCRQLDAPDDRVLPLPCDYRRRPEVERVAIQLEHVGIPVDLVLSWTHDSAIDIMHCLTERFDRTNLRIIRIVGSAYAKPGGPDGREGGCGLPNWGRLQTVILGFVVNGNRSRWLSHEEICDGVIAAVSAPEKPQMIIGTVEPWSARP